MPDLDYSEMDPGSGGENVAGDRITQGSTQVFIPFVQLLVGAMDGPRSLVDSSNPLPVAVQGTVATTQSGVWTVGVSGSVAVTGPLTDAQLRAAPVDVAGPLTDDELRASGVPVLGPLTDAELRNTPVPVSGTFWQAVQPVSGPLTDAQLRNSAVGVTGPLTDAQLRAADVPVSGPLTNAELRATPVPISGTVSITGEVEIKNDSGNPIPVSGTVAVSGAVAVTGPLTDAQLRATAVPISVASLPLPTGAATAAKQPALGTAGVPSADVLTVQGIVDGTPLPIAGAVTVSGSVAVTGPLTDAQLRATAVPVSGTFWQATQPVSNAGTFAVQDSQVLADNGAFTDGSSKVFPAGFIYDEVAGTALTENDVGAARINVNRAQVHVLEDGTTRGRYAGVTSGNRLQVDDTIGAATTANTQVTVGTTSGGDQLLASRSTRRRLFITNQGTTDVYVGVGTVSTANGMLLPGIKGACMELRSVQQVKAIVASGSQAVSVIEEYD